MILEAFTAARDLGRAHDIAAVLVRYGFGDAVRRIGLSGALERAGRALNWRAPDELARLEPPARVRRALEELGPTFVKLGQVLATRVDLFGPEWIAEFGRLQDRAPAVPFDEVRAQLTEDLGEAPETAFADFEPTAMAAASLAQVYRARLASDGRQIVLKVRRPGIRRTVEADLRLLTRLAEIVDAEMPDLRRYRLREVARQFTVSLRRELDFAAECRNAERVAANLAAHPEIVVPRVHWQWTGERLNAQDFVDGIPGKDLAAVDAAGLDRKLLARRGAGAVLKMILEDGFFHADPHPGNVFYLPGNRIAFIDFGMVGRLTETRRFEVVALLHGLATSDEEMVAKVLLDWRDGKEPSDADPARLRAEIGAFVDQYHGVPLGQLDLAALLSDLMRILRDHGLALPPDLALLVKTFITLEGMGRQLDPDFDMAAEAEPWLRKALIAQHSPAVLARRGRRALRSMLELMAGLPQDLHELLRSARRGQLQLRVDVPPLERFGRQIDRAASRLTIGIVTAALIIGSAIVISVDPDSGLSRFGILGFAGAVAGGVWLLISIWRSGRQ